MLRYNLHMLSCQNMDRKSLKQGYILKVKMINFIGFSFYQIFKYLKIEHLIVTIWPNSCKISWTFLKLKNFILWCKIFHKTYLNRKIFFSIRRSNYIKAVFFIFHIVMNRQFNSFYFFKIIITDLLSHLHFHFNQFLLSLFRQCLF